MLKKFLKFLRGGGENSERLEGSYLDDLLERVRPRVEEELERCPEHDPMPVLVAEILREIDEERFGQELRCPVVDEESLPLEAPAGSSGDAPETEAEPPPAPDAPPESEDVDGPSDESGEEESDAGEAEGESSDEERDEGSAASEDTSGDEGPEEAESSGVSESEEDESDASAPEPEVEAPSEETDEGEPEEEAHSTEASDETEESSEADAASDESEGKSGSADAEPSGGEEEVSDGSAGGAPAEAAEPAVMETSVEVESTHAEEAARLEESERTEDGEPRVDSEIVLEMGRVFLGMLVENDALPLDLQMSVEEIEEARRLLSGYFLGGEDVERRAREMLRMVEEKFDEGLFSQARILLQLFDADRQTRIENDRNLFYDEMILRFGIQRRHPVGDDIRSKLDEHLDQFDGEAEDFEDLLVWLSETIYVTLNVYGRERDAYESWQSLAEKSERPGAVDRLLGVIPPARWRLLDEYSRSAAEIIEDRLTSEYVEEYVNDHVKTCYFVLRAVGDTGLEPYLDVFFDWVDQRFDVDGPSLMPWIYTETTANERLIDDIFDELYRTHFAGEVEEMRGKWERDEIDAALSEVVEDLSDADLSEIPPGHYDLGRFVLDKLFEVEYPSAEFSFKMHRLT